MTTRTEKFQRLWAETRPDKPLADLDLYIELDESPAVLILRQLEASVAAMRGRHGRHSSGRAPVDKHLMLGCRGGGKSTELRRLKRELDQQGAFIIETVDLDATGVTASQVSAADVVYMCALALLRRLPPRSAEALFERLKRGYAGRHAGQLGALSDTLAGLRGFGALAGAVAGAGSGLSAVGAAAGGVLVDGLRGGIALWTERKSAVLESSPEGQDLLKACAGIVTAVRDADETRRPVCLLVDGLERMNGEANDRFRIVFEHTGLIAEAPWTAVIAAPPSTLTATGGTAAMGYGTTIVWGFPDQPALLTEMIHARRRAAGLPESSMSDEAIAAMVEACGGLPRHLMEIFKLGLWSVIGAGDGVLDEQHARRAIRAFGQELARGLDEDDFATLKRVRRTGRLPQRSQSASLFASGRILAEPPSDLLIRYRVHPILEPTIVAMLDAEKA